MPMPIHTAHPPIAGVPLESHRSFQDQKPTSPSDAVIRGFGSHATPGIPVQPGGQWGAPGPTGAWRTRRRPAPQNARKSADGPIGPVGSVFGRALDAATSRLSSLAPAASGSLAALARRAALLSLARLAARFASVTWPAVLEAWRFFVLLLLLVSEPSPAPLASASAAASLALEAELSPLSLVGELPRLRLEGDLLPLLEGDLSDLDRERRLLRSSLPAATAASAALSLLEAAAVLPWTLFLPRFAARFASTTPEADGLSRRLFLLPTLPPPFPPTAAPPPSGAFGAGGLPFCTALSGAVFRAVAVGRNGWSFPEARAESW